MPACSFWVTKERNQKLTGRVAFYQLEAGRSWRRKTFVVLMVEETLEIAQSQYPRPNDSYDYKPQRRWRDAHALDLASPSLRWLIDGSEKQSEAA